MNCFPCYSNEDSEDDQERLPVAPPVAQPKEATPSQSPAHTQTAEDEGIAAKSFTFREMATATKNFRQEFLIKDDGFGRVFKGTLSGQVVAIKQLDRNGTKGSKDFLDEVRNLSSLKHPNLIKLIGYCADGDQRILVFDFAPLGSLEPHLLAKPADESPLDWTTRMKIATGAAEGLQYLHEQANPPVIYSDFKSSKILLDEEFNPRLCDFGLAKLAQSGQTASTPPRVMGTYGYSAPEYARTGELTLKSDIYSFGVVLLELITGRRAIDPNRPANEQNLVTWAQPIFRDPKRFSEMADPLLDNKFSVKSLNQAVGVAAMCLQEEPTVRPYISDVVTALSFLDFVVNDPPAPTPSSDKELVKDTNDGDKSDCESESSSLDQNDNDNDDDNSDSPSDHEDDINNDLQADSLSDHEDNDNNKENDSASESHDHKSSSSTDDEDNALVVIEDENRYSSSDNSVDDNSEDETYDDQESQTKSIKKGKAMELSDDESMYSSGSSRSSSSSINDELGGEKSSRQTTQKVKSKKNSVGHLSTKKSKSRWRKAKSVLKHET